MKEFNVTIDRTVRQLRTLTIKADTEEMAYRAAEDIACKNDEEWDGKEYDTKYKIEIKEVQNNYIDRFGNPYDSENPVTCWPAGGGLHKDCEYNADALYAYYVVKDRYKIADYLLSKGFKETLHGADEEIWQKGNTEVTYECYDTGAHLWGYMHTEAIER